MSDPVKAARKEVIQTDVEFMGSLQKKGEEINPGGGGGGDVPSEDPEFFGIVTWKQTDTEEPDHSMRFGFNVDDEGMLVQRFKLNSDYGFVTDYTERWEIYTEVYVPPVTGPGSFDYNINAGSAGVWLRQLSEDGSPVPGTQEVFINGVIIYNSQSLLTAEVSVGPPPTTTAQVFNSYVVVQDSAISPPSVPAIKMPAAWSGKQVIIEVGAISQDLALTPWNTEGFYTSDADSIKEGSVGLQSPNSICTWIFSSRMGRWIKGVEIDITPDA